MDITPETKGIAIVTPRFRIFMGTCQVNGLNPKDQFHIDREDDARGLEPKAYYLAHDAGEIRNIDRIVSRFKDKGAQELQLKPY